MRPEAPPEYAVPFGPPVRVLPGIGVLRPESQTVVSVESGRRAGGHGHPDLLHLSLFQGAAVLADFGTASYVDPSLHWYRSTLAHNAPGVCGRGQWPATAICEGGEQLDGWSWCRVRADGLLGPDSTVVRSVLAPVGDGHHDGWVLDVLTVRAPDEVLVDLPIHPLGDLPATGVTVPESSGQEGAGHETGYGHVQDVRRIPAPDVVAPGGLPAVAFQFVPRAGEVVLTAVGPGPPGADFGPGAPLRFLIRRAAGSGRWIQCVSWCEPRPAVAVRDDTIEIVHAGRRVRVRETADSLTVRADGEAPRVFAARPGPAPDAAPRPTTPLPECEVPLWPDGVEPFTADLPVAEWDLGEGSYRQSERSHAARGATAAAVSVAAQGEALLVRASVTKTVVVARAADAPDPGLDNEPADIHSDGVQIYVGRDRWMGVLAVPELETGTVRVRAVAGTAPCPDAVTGASRRTEEGYEMVLRVPTGAPWRRGDRFGFTVTVNEMVPGRERRSGQLALAGGGWVWLRGDRESPGDAVTAEIA